ncbi:MAG: N-acetylmuramoyl-L-alanine amidase [Coriobacteriia bacterium]|nr:N-acetylmuramoyl-L-alanine amidase [Coriobacteriia bacterium]
MRDDRPTTGRIVTTLILWGVGLLIVFGAIIALATLAAPKTPSDTAPTVEPSASVAPTAAPAAVVTAPAPPPPAPVPTATVPATSTAPTSRLPLTGMTVAIDAGHQAKGNPSLEPIGPGSSTKKPKVTTGATGVRSRVPESKVNLAVSRMLATELKSRGARVVMVRTTQDVNIANSARAKVANEADADLFIRIHCDSVNDRSVRGLSTIVPASNKWTGPILAESRRAGGSVHKSVIAATGAHDRGIDDRGDFTGFNWSKVPTVLVEMGFLSNKSDDALLVTPVYQHKLAIGLADGVAKYLSSK